MMIEIRKLNSLVFAFSRRMCGIVCTALCFLGVQVDSRPEQAVWSGSEVLDSGEIIVGAETQTVGETQRFWLELNGAAWDHRQPLKIEVTTKAVNPGIRVTDEQGVSVPFAVQEGGRFVEVEAGEVVFQEMEGFELTVQGAEVKPSLVVIETDANAPVEKVVIHYETGAGPDGDRLNLTPVIARPAFTPAAREARVTQQASKLVLENRHLKAEFTIQEKKIGLTSLYDEYAGKNILVFPEQTQLFLLEVEGKRYGIKDWTLERVDTRGNTVLISLILPEHRIHAVLTVAVEEQGLQFGLELENRGSRELAWKVAYPQLGGISISDQPGQDYYLFPLRGGLIQNMNVNLRAHYGANIAWWQMINLFSPEKGSGLALRSLDTEGLYKGFVLRKGKNNPDYATLTGDASVSRNDPEYVWKESLRGGEGTSLTIEYPRFVRQPGERIRYPEALLEIHEGDWREPMGRYAQWAHETWEWRPLSSKLDDVWGIQVVNNTLVGGGQVPDLFRDGVWYQDYEDNGYEMSEYGNWWEWSKKGPFGINLKKANEEMGERFAQRYWRRVRNPATGEFAWHNGGRGDYDAPVSWGGWPAMRSSISKAHEAGKLIGLYTSPILADDNSRVAQEHASDWVLMNPFIPPLPNDVLPNLPRDGRVVSYMHWTMCLNNEEYLDFVAKQMAGILEGSGADMIRLDQIGHTGFACYNPKHKHLHGEWGHHVWMRAMTTLTEKVRAATEKVNPDIILMGEYPGNDFLSARLDGTLTYELYFWNYPELRVLPVNIFRFYFPEIKLYELRPQLAPKMDYGTEVSFWNGVGTFLQKYPEPYRQVLTENGDAFNSVDVEALVPTLQNHLYANRFGSEHKQIWTLFNDREGSVNGAVLSVSEDPWVRYVDLLAGKTLSVSGNSISLEIPPKAVVVVARFTRSLAVEEKGGHLQIQSIGKWSDPSYTLHDDQGKLRVRGGLQELNQWLATNTVSGHWQVKAWQGKYLRDMTEILNDNL